MTFVGPDPDILDLFGDKARARAAAVAADVPVINGLNHAVTLGEAREFLAAHGAIIVKAVAGGGGRGTRVVTADSELEATFRRCQSEAKAAFGRESVYVGEYVPRATSRCRSSATAPAPSRIWASARCSIQRRFQKLVEIAPAPNLDDRLRQRIIDAAIRFARHVRYGNLGTFEFLVKTREIRSFRFHRSQCPLAGGAHRHRGGDRRRPGAGAASPPRAGRRSRNWALMPASRIRATSPSKRVSAWKPSPPMALCGRRAAHSPPMTAQWGQSLTDGFGYTGYRTSSAYNSLAKVIAHAGPASPMPRSARRGR